MKKKVLSLCSFALASAMLFSACGGKTPPASVSTPAATTPTTSATTPTTGDGEVTKITVWTKDRHDLDSMTAIVAQLNETFDDMEVVYETYTDNYPNTVQIAAGTGELPDIVCLTGAVVDTLLERDMLQSIEDYISDEMLARFDKSFFIEGVNMKDGKIFSLPNTGTALRLVYNKDIFARVGLPGPPETVAQMAEYAKKITDELSGEGIYGFALPMKNPTSGFRRGFLAIPQLSGLPVYEGFDYTKGEFDFADYKPALEAYKDIFSTGVAFPGCESLDIDPLRTQFADGKIGMYMTYNHSEWGVYTSQFPTEQDWGYAVLPTYDGKITGTQRLDTGFWYGITKNAKNPEKAWRVLEAFYDIENQVPYYENGLGVSVLSDVQAKAKAPDSIEYTPAMAILPTDKPWPLEPRNLTIEGDDWGLVFGAYVFGGKSNIDNEITALNTRYNDAYKKAIADGLAKEIKYPNFKTTDPAGTAN